MTQFDKNLLKRISASPGVYMMKDRSGRALYIGKAKNLRSRVRSYFKGTAGDGRPQIPYLMKEVSHVDTLITENEREALILENALIKRHKPRFNILLKDDKNYTSLRIDPGEEVPRLSYTRRIKADRAVYFGPFSSGGAMRQTKKLIHKLFPLRDCSDEKYKRHRERPCLNYHMKLCLGPCAGKVDAQTYSETVKGAVMLLKGQVRDIMGLLKRNMKRMAREQRFEEAAHFRDQIALLEKNREVDRFIAGSLDDRDVIALFREGEAMEFEVLFFRGGAIVDKAEFSLPRVLHDDREALKEFLTRFYGSERFIPGEILVPLPVEDRGLLEDWLGELAGKRVRIVHPRKGSKVKMVELARRNAEESYRRKHDDMERALALLTRVQGALALPSPPIAIECYDISNLQGTSAVASMVRFEHTRPVRSRYRKFGIKGVEGPNDYAMMHEALFRRLKRAGQEGWELPELILVDGGKGQLNIAVRVLKELGMEGRVALASIAKGKKEGEADKIYVPGSASPVPLPKNSMELNLLMQVRDEAHRFAITYHKKLRTSRALQSVLDTVPGIGEKRKLALVGHFGTVGAMARASVEEIASVRGMSMPAALELKSKLGQ